MRLGLLATLAVGLALTGCTVGAPVASPAPSPTRSPISAETTCTQISDVLTLAINLHKTHSEGRLTDLEFSRTLIGLSNITDWVHAESRSDLKSAVLDLRDTMRNPDSPAYQEALEAMAEACEAGGSQLVILGWTGG